MPKPPPTLSAMTRNPSPGSEDLLRQDPANLVRPLHRAAQRVAARRADRTRRGSRAAPSSGGEAVDHHAVPDDVSALAMAFSTAALLPASWRNARLSGHSSHTAGASGAIASSSVVAAGRSRTRPRSARRRPWPRRASPQPPSPPGRRYSARAHARAAACGVANGGEPSRRLRGMLRLLQAEREHGGSLPVRMSSTPGDWRARFTSIDTMRACACGERST